MGKDSTKTLRSNEAWPMQRTSIDMTRALSQVLFDDVHEQMLNHDVNRLCLRSRFHRHQNGTRTFAMQNATVKSHQGNGARPDFLGVADAVDDIPGKSR